MNEEINQLVQKANNILLKTGKGPGSRYPKELKEIITTLRMDYNLTVKQVTGLIPVSSYSAREWPQRKKVKGFKELKISHPKNQRPPNKRPKQNLRLNYQIMFLSLQILMLAFQVFLH